MERYEEIRSAGVFSVAPTGSYMNVIRESPKNRQRRLELKEKQRELLNMDFDHKRKTDMVQFINSFMVDSTKTATRRPSERNQIRSVYRA